MDSKLEISKAALRRAILDRLSRMDRVGMRKASEAVCARGVRDALWIEARSVLFYAPMTEEVDIWPLARVALEAGKILAFPKYDRERAHYGARRVRDVEGDFAIGQFGIREPADRCEELDVEGIDLAFVPALAFDTAGRRLGRGMGFYDRLLARFKGSACGVAFDEQVVGELPVAEHDVAVDWVLTPTRLMKT